MGLGWVWEGGRNGWAAQDPGSRRVWPIEDEDGGFGYVWVLWVYKFGFVYQRVDKLVGHAIKVPVIKNEVVAPLLPPYFQAMMI